ncbi:MAG: hypothetical protein WCI47_00830 [bacterium]
MSGSETGRKKFVLRIVVIVVLEIAIGIIAGMICANRGACTGECIQIGYSVGVVCFWLGLKVSGALLGASLVVWWFARRKPNS